MNARLLTILVLVFAIGAASWGMRASAQNGTLEDRVAMLEEMSAAHNMQITELFARALPPYAPPNENAAFGFFTLEQGYTFELACNIGVTPMGTQYVLDCMRFQPGSNP